jgi:hypothetical protein
MPVDPGGGPRQLHDFNLERDDGTVEALEVTEATIEELRAANAARDKKLPGATLPAPSLDRSWHIYPSQQTHMGELHKAIPLLAQIEANPRGRARQLGPTPGSSAVIHRLPHRVCQALGRDRQSEADSGKSTGSL